jgi:hypothetical protein
LKSLDKRFKELTTNCAEALLKKNQIVNTQDLKLFISSEKNHENAYQIKTGKAFVVRKDNDRFIRLCQLDPGDIVGNIPFLSTSHEPDSADVYVTKDFDTAEFDLTDAKAEYDELSDTLRNLIKHTAACAIVTTNRLMNTLKKDTA